MGATTGGLDGYAADLAGRFVRPAREDGGERAPVELRSDDNRLPLQDVYIASEALRDQCHFLRRANLLFPCVVPLNQRDRTPIPISLGFEHDPVKSMGRAITSGPSELVLPLVMRFQDRRLKEFESRGLWERSAQFVDLEIDGAITAFEHRLTSFLGTRLQTSLGTQSPSPGLKFTVETTTDHLRVSYHPIFWKSNQRAMNQLSRVATDYIASGQYYFGAALPAQNPQFDFSASYVPPSDSYAKLAL